MNISKHLQAKMNDQEFIDSVLRGTYDLDDAMAQFGYILSYTIATKSKENPKLIDRCTVGNSPLIEETKDIPPKKLRKNIIDDGFFTHSFNGYYAEFVKKHGLGSSEIFDKELEEAFITAEKYLGESKYKSTEGRNNETYITAPGAKTFHYACGFSPERLWLGILRQERSNALPIRIGETKDEYSKRVIQKKIEGLGNSITQEEKEQIVNATNLIINKLCTKKPVVALIPISAIKKKNVAPVTTKNSELKTVEEVLKEDTGFYSANNPISFFTQETNSVDQNNLDNLVTVDPIRGKDIELFEVEDIFSLKQRKAVLQGAKEGNEIDFFTGRVVTTVRGLTDEELKTAQQPQNNNPQPKENNQKMLEQNPNPMNHKRQSCEKY